jgi:hypothetical protein
VYVHRSGPFGLDTVRKSPAGSENLLKWTRTKVAPGETIDSDHATGWSAPPAT